MQRGTKRLYFDNPYQVEFKAQVVKKKMSDRGPTLILDQTCFYPESGGQPSDSGIINGVNVTGVLEEGESIIHLLEEEVRSEEAQGKIDWETRFDHMQQHTGQHILSQSFYLILGANTVSFHLGKEVSTLEVALRKAGEEGVERVEDEANAVVFQNREVKTYFIPGEKIHEIPLRRPPQKKGEIRVVEVSGFDYSACGGTHCRRTGEVGLIKLLRQERMRDNIRFEFVCGKRALKDYSLKDRALSQVANKLSVSERDVVSSVENLFSELKSQKGRVRKLQERIIQFEAEEVIRTSQGMFIKDILRERTAEETRLLALNIIRRGKFVVLFAVEEDRRGHLVFACSETLALDLRELVPVVSPLIEGRGGGSPSLVEVAGEKRENLKLALDRALEFVSSKLP